MQDERPHHCVRLHRRSRNGGARREQHIWNAEVGERPLPLLEEEDALRRRPVVVPGAGADASAVERGLRPEDLLPVDEPRLAAARSVRQPLAPDALLLLDDVRRHLVAEQVEVPVAPQHPVHPGEQLGKPGVGHRREPIGGQPRGGAPRAVQLQRLVRRVGHHQVDRIVGQGGEQLERVGDDDAAALTRLQAELGRIVGDGRGGPGALAHGSYLATGV